MRLQRRGKKRYATYRVVVADARSPVKGKFTADVGYYNPHTDTFKVNKNEATGWLNKGVVPSSTVHNLLVEHGILKAKKVKAWQAGSRKSADGGQREPGDNQEETSPGKTGSQAGEAEKAEKQEPEQKTEQS